MATREFHVRDEEGTAFVVVETTFDESRSVNGPAGFKEDTPPPQYILTVRGAFYGDVELQDDGSFISNGHKKRYIPV